ncbi:reverse transcriptase domain-containing protein [Tanacetum coccineum]
MVKKHDDSWRMCADFKDLNKAYPKDGYPLPEIDWKVESLCGFPFKCFLDAYKGYHQIQMAEEDKEKTAFIMSQGIFCYTKMPFGLRNARATYQHLVDKAFHKQIGRNLEVYVDDLVIKSHMEDEIVKDIEETFKTLKEINMKLNPKKCIFGIEEGMFLGYKVSTRGLKTTEAEEAFKQMKRLITELPRLVAPMEKEALIVYLAAAKEMGIKGSGNKLHVNGIVSASLGACQPEVAARLQKWSIELGEYAIHYRPRVSVKGQILADFIVERPEEDSLDTLMAEEKELPEPWILFMDGSSCTDGSGAGLILTNPEGMEFTYALRFRFGLPGEIISDNGKQFQDNPFKDCLGEGIKARLDKRRKNLMEELPHVLWAHRTMIKYSNEDTPFSLTYGTKAVILVEIGMPTQRTAEVDLAQNNEALEINLDLLEERREQAAIREAKSKQNGKVLQLQS